MTHSTSISSPIRSVTRAGFTLVELAVVLIVIGLLVGALMVGRSIIHAAELRSIITEFEALQAATKQFQIQYNALPGDMPHATRVWGALDDNNTTCRGIPSDGSTKTCNGDGNGKVWVNTNESFRFWQHLNNAGLLAGSYTGTAGSAGSQHAEIGVNVPTFRGTTGIGWSFDESGGGGVWYWDRSSFA